MFIYYNANPVLNIVGDYYDTWDSGDEVLAYYWRKGEQ